jgi:hypothetical protein
MRPSALALPHCWARWSNSRRRDEVQIISNIRTTTPLLP